MLQHLSIQNFTIVKQLELEFKSGMTVLTGETGAGKSILIDALLLTLGERADSKLVAPRADRCSISASFDVQHLPAAQQWLQDHELGETECLLRRTITPDGRSRAFINDQTVSVQMLRELGELLINIHGQHEHQALLKSEHQRTVLDIYAKQEALVNQVATLYQAWRDKQEEYDNLRLQYSERDAKLELLNYQVAELDKLSLQVSELEKLNEEHRLLANAQYLLENAEQAIQILTEEEQSVLPLLNKAMSLVAARKNIDKTFASVAEMLNNGIIQIEEAGRELKSYCDHVELDPARLNWVEQRLATIHEVARKHRVEPEKLFALHEQLQQELKQLTKGDLYLQKLQQEIDRLADQYLISAKTLSQGRRDAAQRLAPAVTELLGQLGMPGGQFQVNLETLDQAEFSAYGLEKVLFYVSTNPGQDLQPIAKVVSGGELSRISLALHVLVTNKQVMTLIFDEVDTGVGGGTAEIVGRMLQKLAENMQVFCVTHLPQVAALAHQHLQVSKQSKNNTTKTEVKSLDKKTKIQEIARMLGGINITEQTLAHAREMIEAA